MNTNSLKRNTLLYLVGMMGAGKTTIGRQLANTLGYRFLDTDALIERSTGQSISSLFAEIGEAAFRALETKILSDLSNYTQTVIATGGGVVSQPVNWQYLKRGIVIWLDVPVAILASRLSEDNTRPLLKGVDLTTQLEALITVRIGHYARSDLSILTQGESADETCAYIISLIEKFKVKLTAEPEM